MPGCWRGLGILQAPKTGSGPEGSFKELGMPRAWRNVLLTIFPTQTIKTWNNGLQRVPVNLMGKLNVKRFVGAVCDGRVHPDFLLLGWKELKQSKNPEF